MDDHKTAKEFGAAQIYIQADEFGWLEALGRVAGQDQAEKQKAGIHDGQGRAC